MVRDAGAPAGRGDGCRGIPRSRPHRRSTARLMFHQSGGCCDGSAPMCYPVGMFITGPSDVLPRRDGRRARRSGRDLHVGVAVRVLEVHAPHDRRRAGSWRRASVSKDPTGHAVPHPLADARRRRARALRAQARELSQVSRGVSRRTDRPLRTARRARTAAKKPNTMTAPHGTPRLSRRPVKATPGGGRSACVGAANGSAVDGADAGPRRRPRRTARRPRRSRRMPRLRHPPAVSRRASAPTGRTCPAVRRRRRTATPTSPDRGSRTPACRRGTASHRRSPRRGQRRDR